MALTIAAFRSSLGQVFANPITYPDEAVTFWLGIAGAMLNPYRWGPSSIPTPPPAAPVVPALPLTQLDYGTLLFVAHNLVLEAKAAQQTSRGGSPGGITGAVASDSVGPISRSYDTSASLELEGGNWNLTTYGLRFVRLANMIGTGPLQVGGGVGFPWFWDGNPAAAYYPGPNWPPWGGPPSGFGPGWNGG